MDNTPYDDVFRTLLTDCTELMIPVVNEIFHTKYTGKETICLLQNEHFIKMPDGSEQERITDGLVAKRNRFSKTIFDTEGDDPDKVKAFNEFVAVLRESAEVFKLRRMQKVERYRELLEKRKSQSLHGTEEDEYLNLYRVLSSYGMVEKLPQKMLESKFDKDLEQLLKVGDAILKEYGERE